MVPKVIIRDATQPRPTKDYNVDLPVIPRGGDDIVLELDSGEEVNGFVRDVIHYVKIEGRTITQEIMLVVKDVSKRETHW